MHSNFSARSFTWTALAVMLFAASAVSAANDQIDQNQPIATNPMANFLQEDLAQSFMQTNGNISGAGILLQSGFGSSDTVTIQLWDALPNQSGTMLAQASATGTAGQWVDVFWAAVPVPPMTTYYLVFTGNTSLSILGATSNVYPFGQVFANVGYIPFPQYDYTFRTYYVECLTAADCYDDVFCNGLEQCEAGECVPGELPFCPSDAPVCDEDNNSCVECLDASDCANDNLYCTGDPVCTDTICGFADDPCGDDTPVCDEDNNSCVECLLNEHCPAGYACIDSVCRVSGTFLIDKATVKAGKTGNSDSITFSGLLDASEADLDAALEIIVTIKAEDIPDPGLITFIFPISEYYFSKGKYKSPKDTTDPVLKLQLDTIKGTMKFSAKNADLTGLSCPITVMIEIGEYIAETELDENIVNGPKKPCPSL